MKLAIAIFACFACFAGETLASHKVHKFIIPSTSAGSTSYDAYDDSLKYRKSIDAAERGSRYANSYYNSRPSYGWPGGYYPGNYYNYPPPPAGTCGWNPGPYYPPPLPYYYQPAVNYGSSSGSEYNNDLRYRKSLDLDSNGESYQNSYYNGFGPWY